MLSDYAQIAPHGSPCFSLVMPDNRKVAGFCGRGNRKEDGPQAAGSPKAASPHVRPVARRPSRRWNRPRPRPNIWSMAGAGAGVSGGRGGGRLACPTLAGSLRSIPRADASGRLAASSAQPRINHHPRMDLKARPDVEAVYIATAISAPAHGWARKSSAVRKRRWLVTNSTFPPAPPKQGIVGRLTGSGTTPARCPSGRMRSIRLPPTTATQMAPSASATAPSGCSPASKRQSTSHGPGAPSGPSVAVSIRARAVSAK